MNSSDKYQESISGNVLSIRGFGNFENTRILSVTGQRFIAGRNAVMDITAPAASDLGIVAGDVNVPVVAHIRVNTTRHSSEWAIDFIKRGRPFVFEILVNGAETSAQVAAKLTAAFAEYEAKFNYSDRGLPYTWSLTGDVITLTLKDPYLSLQNYVDFLPKGLTYGVKAVTTTSVDTGITVSAVTAATTVPVSAVTGLLVGDTVTLGGVEVQITSIDSATPAIDVSAAVTTLASDPLLVKSTAQEPTFDGKYLEENVRMSLPSTSDSYGISPDEKPVIKGSYTAITFVAKDDNVGGVGLFAKKHKFLGSTRGELGGERQFIFTLYFLEGTDMFNTGGKVDTILSFLYAAAAVKDLKIANGETVTTVADFIA